MSSPEDLASADEVKVYEDEGEEEGKSSEENLSEEKAVLVEESEEGTVKNGEEGGLRATPNQLGEKSNIFPFPPGFPYPPFLYQYPGLSSRLGCLSPSLYNKEKLPLIPPPPAHMGYPPRLPPYGSPGLLPFYQDYAQCLSRFSPLSPASMLAGRPFLPGSPSSFPPIPPLLPLSPSQNRMSSPKVKNENGQSSPSVSSKDDFFHSFSRNPMFFPPFRHNGLLTTDSRFFPGGLFSNNLRPNGLPEKKETPKKPMIKKPLNAFMLFMKDMRQSVIEECTLKESAAINQILGRKWHALGRSEQNKYYEMAKKEKELHAQKYPGWSARDNYAMNSKKKKRKLDSVDGTNSSDSDSARPIKLKPDPNQPWNPNAPQDITSSEGGRGSLGIFSPYPQDFGRTNNISISSL